MKTIMYPRILAAKLATFDLRTIERGDADTSASTLRTAGAVFLVLLVTSGIVAALLSVGNAIRAAIASNPWYK
jgi:cell division protein FtsX